MIWLESKCLLALVKNSNDCQREDQSLYDVLYPMKLFKQVKNNSRHFLQYIVNNKQFPSFEDDLAWGWHLEVIIMEMSGFEVSPDLTVVIVFVMLFSEVIFDPLCSHVAKNSFGREESFIKQFQTVVKVNIVFHFSPCTRCQADLDLY